MESLNNGSSASFREIQISLLMALNNFREKGFTQIKIQPCLRYFLDKIQ